MLKRPQAAEKAIELGSTDVAVFRTRWEAYRLSGDEAKTAEAQADLEKFGLLAEEAKRIYNEGIALLKAGDKEGAFVKFEQALDADPNLEPALFAVATTGLEIGKPAVTADGRRDDSDQQSGQRGCAAPALQRGAWSSRTTRCSSMPSSVSLPSNPRPQNRTSGFWPWPPTTRTTTRRPRIASARSFWSTRTMLRRTISSGLVYLGEGANEETREHLETLPRAGAGRSRGRHRRGRSSRTSAAS